MLHPFSAHFAVALPLLATLLSLSYFIFKKEFMMQSSTYIVTLGAIAMIVAYFTGDTAGYAVWESVSSDAQSLIEEHAQFAVYVIAAVIITSGVKIFALVKKSMKVEMAALALLFITSIMILNQGKMGGQLVYTHGAGVEKQTATTSLH